MSGTGNLQGFPQNSAPVVDQNNGLRWTQPWLQFMISLWRRTGTAQGGTSAPTASGQAFLGPVSAIPSGWLLCDGSAVSRIDYAALYSVIGTYWGAGDGVTTFNLPALTNRFLVGSGTLAFANRGGNLPTTGGSGNGFAVVNWIIKI
jgi:hypothetical protein